MASRDFEGELIKVIEEANGSHASGVLKLASGEHIDFKFGTPYHAASVSSQGMEALDEVLAAILSGSEFTWDPLAPVDSDKATITLSALRLMRRIKDLSLAATPGGAPAAKIVTKPAVKTKAPYVRPAKPAAKAPAVKLPPPSLDLSLVAEKLPILPLGGEFPHDSLTIPAILFHLTSGVIESVSPSLRGLVIVIDGRLTDAVAVAGSKFLEGPSALDAITLDASKKLTVRTLPTALASALPYFWKLPVRVRDLQARWVGGPVAVQNFIKPDAWGVVQIRSEEDTALVFFSHGQVLLAYSVQQPTPLTDLSALASLLGAETAVISARVEDEAASVLTPSAPVMIIPAPPASIPALSEESVLPVIPTPAPPAPIPFAPVIPTPTPPAVVPVVEPVPVAVVPTPPPPPVESVVVASDATIPAASPLVPAPTPLPVATTWVAEPEARLDVSVLDRIVAMIRGELKFHAPPVEAEFTSAELTRSGLLKAAKRVRAMRPRVISEERMESIGTRAINIVTGREAA